MIEIKNVSKSYGGVQSLKDVNLQVKRGEIHAILGENGAGKSTLMKIIAGAIERNGGTMSMDGTPVEFQNTQAAKNAGIGIIYQEFSLVPALSVAENIFLHKLAGKRIINWNELYQSADKLIKNLGFNLNVKSPVSELSISQQQVVEISKALTEEVRLLILDEPSAVLGPAETHKLFATLRALRDKGVAIIYISHHLEELFELCDRITVLKDGVTVKTFETGTTSKDELVQAMLGRSLKAMFPDRSLQPVNLNGRTYYLDNISVLGQPAFSLHVKAGEILGIGGLVGSGRTELLRAVFGADSDSAKKIRCDQQELTINSPKEAVAAGIGMVPEDRKHHGGLLNISILENISITNYKKVKGMFGFINRRKEEEIAASFRKRLNIKLSSLHDPLSSLSGGNQQKVILAKWLNIDAGLLLIDEPTRGVDVGARSEIYQIIHELSASGLAIIMVSSDREELMGLSDRIMVMKSGKVQGVLGRPDFSEESFLRLAIGATNDQNKG
ncbi:MAG: sugar ABC transporter ATP-binding protein [Pseudobacter sp.]|uniref:sugar ABC transporter ATP-binding protein n=1 Tax=Pseudobacter sp. TaxID=2045420 RepID=UPI003F81501D